ncbi:alpha/beta fold hydrolase [Photorhabdus khanii]|uniref:Alpha/beta fold hydrolase n=1 Tax=Photorhabdus khanii TaxID=1004150 RepID=A0A7C9GM12_9GAMM|nr:alpha/beta fold hydrolase [Photorhabdus khanii]MQL47519.1 alpha/beta fold hydrolase [Photorhabdus khanii]
MSNSVLFPAIKRPEAEVQLVFLHHAGGSSYPYLQLAHKLSGLIEAYCLELAGRGARISEPFQSDVETVLSDILAAIKHLGLGEDKPLLLCGHSLGAELAYQTAYRLEREAPGKKLSLIISARSFVEPDVLGSELHDALSDADILHLLEQYEGTPSEILADPEWRKYVISVMRNDLRLLASLSRLPKPALNVQAHLVGGDQDRRVPVSRLAEWNRVFTVPVTQKIFTGGHFYLFTHDEVIPWIEERARELAEQTSVRLSHGSLTERDCVLNDSNQAE